MGHNTGDASVMPFFILLVFVISPVLCSNVCVDKLNFPVNIGFLSCTALLIKEFPDSRAL